MAKKRRERDKPKAAPNSVYNPNKRVLLSYASDDEVDETVEKVADVGNTGGADKDDQATSQLADAETKVEDGVDGVDVVDAVPAVVVKEDTEKAPEEKSNEPGLFSRSTGRDPTTGQWPAIGTAISNWDDESDEDVEFEAAEDEAMAYLRAVRDERQIMPTVFRAPFEDPTEELYESGVGDGRGYFEDGAYVGRANIGPVMPDSAKTTIEPQEAYTRALKQRFAVAREQMHSTPDSDDLAKMDEEHPTTYRQGDNKAHANWKRILTTTMPSPTQVQALDTTSVDRLLEVIMRVNLIREQILQESTSVWIWSLLARLDDVGSMNNQEVYAIREFGKKAVLVQLSLYDPVAAAQLEAMSNEGGPGQSDDSAVEGEASNGEAGDSPALDAPAVESPAAHNTAVTLDMIITIIGEVFGQRDLLEFRRPWEMTEIAPTEEPVAV
ncbi:hypothetical protein LTR56_003123 [Elasticomyces elasticus]|nr:hypothetical protein LTR22_014343 [Elasticomyces elasticus]KAK3656420.1 hypothetical protein LTR56_003123 [Elasticomyces elasticus]KAK4910520.1 hypothetical protein LTR49_020786 [Elasticomyces elasticus]KAK5750156.1 hypothetical protein LTS12_019806 [Elasticomyces elasticus]